MQMYIIKNNQQQGPFEESNVLEMFKNGELSANDLGIRNGENQWQKLEDFFPRPEPELVAVSASNSEPKKRGKSLLFGCSGFFLIAVLVSGVLGFLAFRNLRPADSTEDLPNTVNDFKINERYPPKGNIWGTETYFVGIYSDPTNKTLIYMNTIYSSESAADKAFLREIYSSCRSGEVPLKFKFVKNGTEISEGATCGAALYVKKDNKIIALGGNGVDVESIVAFAETLPFNQGSKMEKK